MKTKKKISYNRVMKCDKFLNNNKELILFNHIEDLIDSIKLKCKNVNWSLINIDNIKQLTLEKLKKKKGSIQFLLNAIFRNYQYFNVSGFSLIKLINNKRYEIKYTTLDKKIWHKSNLNLLKIIDNHNNNNKNSLILMNEEYDLNMVNSKNNSNQNEFKTIYNNKYVDTSSNFIKNEEEIFHTYYDIKIREDNFRIVNIHSGSGLNQDNLITKLKNFLEKFPRKKNQNLILGGDSNLYYNRGESKDEKKWSGNGISNLNKFIKKMYDIKYIVLVSKNIIYKTRPYNFFNNAQSAFKNGDEPVETMIICIPLKIYFKYKYKNEFYFDDKNYFISIDSKNKMKNITVNDFYKNKLNAFQGSEYITKTGKINISYNDIFDSNKGGALISDHVPIYLDIGNFRLIFSNNASLIGGVGINNNMGNKKMWKGQLLLLKKNQTDKQVNNNIKYLDKLSTELIKIILKNNLSLIEKLNVPLDKNKFSKLNEKEKLRYLTNLQICLV